MADLQTTLPDKWIQYYESLLGSFLAKRNTFPDKNVYMCVKEFKEFATTYDTRVRNEAANQSGMNYKWLGEQINQALDVYWAPLSQALAQYASPAYQESLGIFRSGQILIVDQYLKGVNNFLGLTKDQEFTQDDIVLFFDGDTLIRRPPYTKKALISIPFRAFDSRGSYINQKATGIAHELGHFLYWRLGAGIINEDGKESKIVTEVNSLLKGGNGDIEISFVKPWIEEMFADFIGAKIATVEFVNSCKDLINGRNKTSSSLGENDYEHTPDILRLLLCIYAAQPIPNRSDAILQWKNKYKEIFPEVDTDKITIENVSETGSEKKLATELCEVIFDTVDIFNNADQRKSFLTFPTSLNVLTQTDVLTQMINRAMEIKKDDYLTLLLDPIGLEAGINSLTQLHRHWFTTVDHPGRSYHLSHT